MNKNQVDIFVIVSSDGGYEDIMRKAREKGKRGIVIGERKTPDRLIQAACQFIEV